MAATFGDLHAQRAPRAAQVDLTLSQPAPERSRPGAFVPRRISTIQEEGGQFRRTQMDLQTASEAQARLTHLPPGATGARVDVATGASHGVTTPPGSDSWGRPPTAQELEDAAAIEAADEAQSHADRAHEPEPEQEERETAEAENWTPERPGEVGPDAGDLRDPEAEEEAALAASMEAEGTETHTVSTAIGGDKT